MSNVTEYQFAKALEQFDYPPSLTAQEKDRMRQRKMKKHDVAIVLIHWFNAFTWIFMLLSGTALIVSHYYKIMPLFYINIVHGLFSSSADMIQFHIWLGVIWAFVISVYTVFGYRKYVRKHRIKDINVNHHDFFERLRAFQCIFFGNDALCLDKDDLKWLKIRLLGILGKSNDELPPQGSFNAGQKLYGLLVALMTPIIIITGLIMAFHLGGIVLVQWAIPIHFFAVGMIVSGLMIHVYMGAVFPEEKPSFFSMITGNVSELFLYKHHFKFWRDRIIEQFAWRKESGADVNLIDLLPDGIVHKVESKLEEYKDLKEPVKTENNEPTKLWNPYLTGTLLGLTLLITFVLLGRGLGASSFLSRTGTFMWNIVAPTYTQSNPYWSRYFANGHTPLGNFMIFEVLGLLAGAFWSGYKSKRNKIEVHKGPNITKRQRIIYAFSGGILMGIGARIARGCTSGMGLTGGGTLAVGGWIFVLAVFAAGYLSAYIFRRLWL